MPRLLPLVALVLAAPALAQPADGPLTPFASDSALTDYVRALTEQWQQPARPRPIPTDAVPASTQTGCDHQGEPPAAIVSGRVLDGDTGDPLIGANVLLRAPLPCGAATNLEGAFRLHLDADAVADSTVTLQVSYAGYSSAEVQVAVSPGDSAAVEVSLTGAALGEVVVASVQAGVVSGLADESVTNTQTEGVDEGGIVKLHGGHLVILRRGRLFTVAIGDGALDPVDVADASGPELDPEATWYDELLIVGETVVVVGYSYQRAGTELVLFDLGTDGRLSYRSTYHLRSNDYYSSENYASRVVDGRLVFYTPLRLPWTLAEAGADGFLPALRRWAGDAQGRFEPIASATSVYRPARELRRWGGALHTVTSCAIADGAMDCTATAVLGAFGHTFYVSGTAVYVWLSGWAPTDGAEAVLYRLPLDGGPPSALGVQGGPIDQFSFLEADDTLQVVSTDWGGGQWMWRSEVSRQDLALLQIPLDEFGDGASDAPEAWYHHLPVPAGGVDVNRFVGDHLLYGSSRATANEGRVQAVAWARPQTAWTIPTGHATERIEVLGRHAIVVGSDRGDLRFSSIQLGDRARRAGAYRMANAAQGETRSHGFFYRPSGDQAGTLGLPVRRRGGRYASLRDGSASVVYLRNDALQLRRLGDLDADPAPVDDHCVASCVDWYGNARPLFVGDRVFALLGYEIVEGRVWGGRIQEAGRVSFAPTQAALRR